MSAWRPRNRSGLRQWCIGLILATATVAVASATAFELPPIAQPASGEHHPGKMIWADLVTPDLVAAKRFYGGLFGWTFRDIHGRNTEYAVALLDGAPVGGLVQRALRPHRHPAWLTFIAVKDIVAAERSVLTHGGKEISQPRMYLQRGKQAVFADPQGAVFGALQSSSGDPADVQALPGEWIWSSLVTSDPREAAAFYQAILGYEIFDFPSDDGLEHLFLATDNYARASSNTLPPGANTSPPHWLNFIRVSNAAEAAAKVRTLGGQVLVAPHPDRHGGMVAVVADPAGATFGLLEWTGTDSSEGAK
ncbi:putative glyoxylase CFP32 [Sideroxyarcus emersonii]|uniref:Glyoxylase CFP32 n=1 Tax=Sideroxyarcus emersonii TaxID=2764705 RepID=A0AAN1X9Z3_9PROT|nr:VOC family protein [Sideroxyarcus emersonii]BCK87540.1 putative glyoxylase CFP32 [Sideroxyarcus emersonii]